jgi:hypothetical protein
MSEIGLQGKPVVVNVDFSQAEPSIDIIMVNWTDNQLLLIYIPDRVRTDYTFCHNSADCSGRRLWYGLIGLSCDADHELVEPGKIP